MEKEPNILADGISAFGRTRKFWQVQGPVKSDTDWQIRSGLLQMIDYLSDIQSVRVEIAFCGCIATNLDTAPAFGNATHAKRVDNTIDPVL
jgi:hypothetical protein